MPITQKMLPALIEAASREGIAAATEGAEGVNQQRLAKLKSVLQSQSQQTSLDRLKDFLTNNKDILPEGSGISVTPEGASVTRGVNYALQGARQASNEAKTLDAAKQKTLGKMEEGLGMAQNAEAFLQNPNAFNTSELKVLIPMMQGWPARAIGTESKASGFDPGGWNTALHALNKYADNPQGNPLTQQTLDTMRSNFAVLKKNMSNRYQKASDNFWTNTAPSLAPSLASSGQLDKIRAGHEAMISNTYGDLQHNPWEPGTQAAQQVPSQSPAATPPTSAPTIVDRLKSFFSVKSSPQQQAAPAAAQAGHADAIAQELAKRAKQALNQPQQQPAQGQSNGSF